MTANTTPRQRRMDLSRLTVEQRHMRELVMLTGTLAFGRAWQTPYAEALSEAAGRTISQAQISHWISGQRGVPDSLKLIVEVLSLRLATDLDRRSKELRKVWTAHKDALMPPADPEVPPRDEFDELMSLIVPEDE